jgi:hypothetical protein
MEDQSRVVVERVVVTHAEVYGVIDHPGCCDVLLHARHHNLGKMSGLPRAPLQERITYMNTWQADPSGSHRNEEDIYHTLSKINLVDKAKRRLNCFIYKL